MRPQRFNERMNNGLRGLIENTCFVYTNDIIVFGTTLEEHYKNLNTLFERLATLLELDKCEYLKPELSYLGHKIYAEGIKPNLEKIEKIENYPTPRNPKEIK